MCVCVCAPPVARQVKNPLSNSEDAGHSGSIPGSGRYPGIENGSSILAWEMPWTEEPGGLQSMEPQSVGHNWATEYVF